MEMTTIQARIPTHIKEEATKIISSTGLGITDIMRVVITHIVNTKTLPLDYFQPNEETLQAMQDANDNKVTETSIEELMQIIDDAQKSHHA